MDSATIEMLQSSLVHVLTEDADGALAERLDALGWEEVLAEDAPSALRALFEAKGTTLSPADALGPMLAHSIADALGQPRLTSAAIVLPASLQPDRLSTQVKGDSVAVDGVLLSRPADAAPAVVPAETSAGDVALAIVDASDLHGEPIEGIDPSLGWLRATATMSTAAVTLLDGEDAPAAWEAATGRARWALGAELVAIGRHVIAEAVAYSRDRKQYGRPIGSFQAVQHRLASAQASVVGASHVVIEASTSGSPWAALVAKALAGRAAESACTQAQQAYGAIGFTWEHEFHRYLRRTYVLDRLFGDWRSLERQIGRRLLDMRTAPRIGSL